jgi:hypothetical protein
MAHMDLDRLVRLAYSAEKAAAYAYRGHARSVRDHDEQVAVRNIEIDEWQHRENLARFMAKLGIRPSRWLELKYHVIGKLISISCHLIGHFLPMYFAGRLESGNVNEYLLMERLAAGGVLADEIPCIRHMAAAEKRHELYLLERAARHRVVGIFGEIFKWGPGKSLNPMPPPEVDDVKANCQKAG